MRIVAALGGNALLRRGEKPDAAIQIDHIRAAAQALAPLAMEHELLICHGNGPQVGMLSMESENDTSLTRPYPLDVLVAQTQGMIGYWLVRALRGAAPGKPAGCLIGQGEDVQDHPVADAVRGVQVGPEGRRRRRAGPVRGRRRFSLSRST